MEKKTKIIYGLIGVALIVFAFTDLQISQAVFGENNGFGIFFETYGEVPMMLVGSFSSAAMIITSKKKKSISNALLVLVFILNTLGAALLPSMYLKLSPLVTGFIALVVGLVVVLGVYRISPSKYDKLRQISKIGVVLSLAPILLINIIKMLWGRERYRNMIDPIAQFTPWFIPQGFTTNNEFMSFPSGHSANSAVILWITLLPIVFDKLKKLPLEIVAWFWTLTVMFSRIVVGAHFASDVTMGMALTFTMFLILKKRYIREV